MPNSGKIVKLADALEQSDYSEVYKILSDANMDINQTGRCGWTPLLVAIDNADLKAVEAFLKAGANPNSKVTANEYDSAMRLAVKGAKKEPTKHAIYYQIAQLLLDYDVMQDSDTFERTSLHLAVIRGLDDFAILLASHGYNVLKKDKMQRTPVMIATDAGNKSLANDLLVYAAFWSPSLSSTAKQFDDQSVRMISQGFFARTTARTCYDDRALLDAVSSHDLDNVKRCLETGYVVDDELVHSAGTTPLERAAKAGDKDIVALLAKKHSILSDDAYYNASGKAEIQDILNEAKAKQMQVLKDAFELSDEDVELQPSECRLG